MYDGTIAIDEFADLQMSETYTVHITKKAIHQIWFTLSHKVGPT